MPDEVTIQETIRDVRNTLMAHPLRCSSLLNKVENTLSTSSRLLKKSLFIHGTHNIEFLRDYIRLLGLSYYIDFDISIAPFDPRQLEILSNPSLLINSNADYIFFADSWRTLESNFQSGEKPEHYVGNYFNALNTIQSQTRSSIFIHNLDLPHYSRFAIGGADFNSFRNYIRSVNNLFDQALNNTHGIYLLDINYLSANVGADSWSDDRLWYTSHQHWSPTANVAISRELVLSICQQLETHLIKVLVCDLDGTLWGGIAADDGVENIRIAYGDAVGESYLELHNTIKAMKENGLVLAITSKNDPDTVFEVFTHHRHMPLMLDDFSAVKINWERKSHNIEKISASLNISLDAIAVIDDNPREISEIQDRLPSVTTIYLDGDPAQYPNILVNHIVPIATMLTHEDKQRTELYKSYFSRLDDQDNHRSYNNYLQNLNIHVVVKELIPADIPRVVQLLNKTNQFNINLFRTNRNDIEGLLSQPEYHIYTCQFSDKFGDNGIVSVIIWRVEEDALCLVNWVLSCRVFNLNIEHYLLEWSIGKLLVNKTSIYTQYVPGKKNALVPTFLTEVGFHKESASRKCVTFRALRNNIKIVDISHITPGNSDVL